MKRIDLTGKRFGRLVVLRPTKLASYKQLKWLCQCDCGKTLEIAGLSLRNGDTNSCGCFRREKQRREKTIHGAYFNRSRRERLYNIYSDMKARCYNKNEPAYKWYGARGISICQEWLRDYQAFREWALSHGYSDTLTLDRENNDGNYEPDNCRWVTMKIQANNKRMGLLPQRDCVTGRFAKGREQQNG